mmetsp:Transcript_85144/g.249336  ORF Transcript_85144/g.249336 Transcript_85144/m.249336 type:complete len:583 (+) Transcript_85144:34-1782(+)
MLLNGESAAGNGTCSKHSPAEGLSAELIAALDLLLQKHHDRLICCLQPRGVPFPRVIPPQAPGTRKSAEFTLQRQPEMERADSTPSLKQVRLNVPKSDRRTRKSVKVPKEVPPEPEEEDNQDSEEESAISTFSQAEEMKRIASLSASAETASIRHAASSFSDRQLERISGWSDRVGTLVNSHWFELAMSILIMSNALYCGLEVEYAAQTRSTELPATFSWISLVYTIFFTLELLLRLFVERASFFYKTNWRWNYFDLFIVGIALFELMMQTGGEASRQVPSIRVIRMARVIRVLRIARIMRHFRSLRILIYSVLNTLRSLVWTMLLLGLILYVFGILFTQAAMQHILMEEREIPHLEASYGSVGRSVFTLFTAISGGVSWQEIVEPLFALHGVWVAFYLLYFAFVYFAVLNVVTGVFCQTAIESANHDQDMATQAQMSAKQQYISKLKQLFQQVDLNNSGEITLSEFEDSMKDEKLLAYFASIDITIDEAFSLFKLLDHDNTHSLNIDAFVTGCLKLRGQAKSLDIAMMMYETRWSMQRCFSAIKSIEDQFTELHDCIIPPLDLTYESPFSTADADVRHQVI